MVLWIWLIICCFASNRRYYSYVMAAQETKLHVILIITYTRNDTVLELQDIYKSISIFSWKSISWMLNASYVSRYSISGLKEMSISILFITNICHELVIHAAIIMNVYPFPNLSTMLKYISWDVDTSLNRDIVSAADLFLEVLIHRETVM